MIKDIDNTAVELDCPSCARKFSERLGRLKNDPTVHCPGCKQTIRVEASHLRQALKRVQVSVDKLGRALDRLGKPR